MQRTITRRSALRRIGTAGVVAAGATGTASAVCCDAVYVELYNPGSYEFEVCSSDWTWQVTEGPEGDEGVDTSSSPAIGFGNVGADGYEKWKLTGVTDVQKRPSATDDDVDVVIYGDC